MGIQRTFSKRRHGPATGLLRVCAALMITVSTAGWIGISLAAEPEIAPGAGADNPRSHSGPGPGPVPEADRDRNLTPCPAPDKNQSVIITRAEGWRTLVTRSGARLTLTGMADFGVLEPQRADMVAAADQALTDTVSGLTGRPLKVHYLDNNKTDRRGRLPVLLYEGTETIQAQIIRSGAAIAFPDGEILPCAAELLAAEEAARRARRGFWKSDRDWIADARPEHFAGRLNRYVIVAARVVSVGTRARRTYLNFGGRWATDVTVEVPGTVRDRMGGDAALEALTGQKLRVRGFVIEKSGPMIEVRRPWQIEVLTKSPE